jgi:hypothetical protein
MSESFAGLVREARLRPEFAGVYPQIRPGLWLIAATIASARRHEDPPPARHERLLPEKHFEFRGGDSAPRYGDRTRSSDEPGWSSAGLADPD